MDVTCAACGEPWELHHLLHDEVYETEAGQQMIVDKLDREDWDQKQHSLSSFSRRELAKLEFQPQYQGEKWERKLTDFWREQFKALGWKFGTTVSVVLECPCCSSNGKLVNAEERLAAAETIDSCDGDDLDGAAVDIADMLPQAEYAPEDE